MSEFDRQVERQVLRTRALLAEDQRDEWKARAEKAERLIAVSRPPATTCQVCACVSSECDATLERAERAEAQIRANSLDLMERHNRDVDVLRMSNDGLRAENAALVLRAERAEALLREGARIPQELLAASLHGDGAHRRWLEERFEEHFDAWRAKVRDLLEGKHDKG